MSESYEVVESKITYTTKELLSRIDKRFEHLESIAEAAATRSEMYMVTARVDKLERDSEGTKAVATALLNSGKDRFSRNEKVIGLVFASVALAPSIAAIINLFHH
jgi:predicted ABC-type transport system involved in lysophospholipase L1 biosynthesis ATPase subunit